MKKEKIHLEYLLNATSKNILWAAISTPLIPQHYSLTLFISA